MTALFGPLLAGCGGETGIDEQSSESSDSESVSEAPPTSDTLDESENDSGQPSPQRTVSAAALGCPATSVSWSQWQPSWNGNTGTAGTYVCYGDLPATNSGYIVTATRTSLERTGTAQYTCSNGVWVLRSGSSCNGKIISTVSASAYSTTCSSTEPVRAKWISWYLADLKRCADSDGLEWWVSQYNNSTGCPASNNYDGYGTKDACWRASFRNGANTNGNSYNEAQALGHISSWDESSLCGGSLAYPWTSVSSFGTSCKYRP
ncbi:hypothetical protein [Archangium sp.]|jgi:hypothetical protein|uniref:hypothetical protein n=1 Tax=Archangium sp. TaxID=1872627 RepID=UPI002ED7F6F0